MSDRPPLALCPCCGQVLQALPPVGSEGFGARLRVARIRAGLTQGELGRLLSRGRTHAAISELEHGKVRVQLKDAEEIASLLNLDISWLLGLPSND